MLQEMNELVEDGKRTLNRENFFCIISYSEKDGAEPTDNRSVTLQ